MLSPRKRQPDFKHTILFRDSVVYYIGFVTAAEMKYMRRAAEYTWKKLENKCTNCEGVQNNTNFGQITGIQ